MTRGAEKFWGYHLIPQTVSALFSSDREHGPLHRKVQALSALSLDTRDRRGGSGTDGYLATECAAISIAARIVARV